MLRESAAANFTCTITDAAAGAITMELPNATSSGIAAGRYYYDLEILQQVIMLSNAYYRERLHLIKKLHDNVSSIYNSSGL